MSIKNSSKKTKRKPRFLGNEQIVFGAFQNFPIFALLAQRFVCKRSYRIRSGIYSLHSVRFPL